MVVTPTGKRSVVTKTVVYNRSMLPAVNYTANNPGLRYQLFPGEYTSVNDFKLSSQGADSLIIKNFNVTPFKKLPSFGVIYTGYIRIDSDGVYGFSITSDDGSILLIDDQPVVENDGKHPLVGKNGSVALQKGYHRFTLKYFNTGITGSLRVYMTIPGRPMGELSPDILFN
jgi:hexosaminidase